MTNSQKISFEELYFFWRVADYDKDRIDIPPFLPFEFDYDTKLDLVTQKSNKVIDKNLNRVYVENYNIGNIQDSNEWGDLYGAGFLRFIAKNVFKGEIKNVLEIGCGGCSVLETLKNKGLNVTGIDPSPIAAKQGAIKGVKVINDFYPSTLLNDRFDLILHSDVMEHIKDPINFLKLQHSQLTENGRIIIMIPDCSQAICSGDISMILHQHYNFFDRMSLKNVLRASGFKNIKIERSGYGSSLYATALKSSKKISPNGKESKEKYYNFIKKAKKNIARFELLIKPIIKNKKKTLGFYAPTRAFPYMAGLDLYDKIRFFDDAERWHGKYFDPIPAPIENFKDLIKNPVTDLFIMSPTFGNAIEDKVRQALGKSIRVYNLEKFV